MIRTIKGTRGSWLNLGNLQTQPTIDPLTRGDADPIIQKPSVRLNSTVWFPVTVTRNSEPVMTERVTVHELVSLVLNDGTTVLSPYSSRHINTIFPSYAIHLEPGNVNHPHDDELKVSSKTFVPYEILTGISQERPEIIMLTNFLPLFDNEINVSSPSFIQQIENGGIYSSMTDTGRYVDTHLQARNLRRTNVVFVLRNLKKNYRHIREEFTRRKQEFEKNINSLHTTTNFLLDLVRQNDKLKSQLDIRDKVHIVNVYETLKSHQLNYAKINLQTDVLHEIPKRYLKSNHTFLDVLVDLGFKSNSIKNDFSSTKIWMQTLYELKEILQFHSLDLIDATKTTQKKDKNPISISKHTVKKFGIKQNLRALPSIKELSSLNSSLMVDGITSISKGWRNLYQNNSFKTREANVAALVNLISKEFRYSSALASPEMKHLLHNYYSYDINSSDNTEMFNEIIGKFGQNITEFSSISRKSLVDVSQLQPSSNVAVLTFESKYIDGSTGTLTPGGVFFIDQILQTDGKSFDVKKLSDLSLFFEQTHSSLNNIVSGMNLFGVRSTNKQDRSRSQYSSILSSPVDFIKSMLVELVDEKTGQTLPKISNDNLGSVYSYATTNSTIKSALFLYTLTKISRSYHKLIPLFDDFNVEDNTILTEKLIDSIIFKLKKDVSSTNSSVPNSSTRGRSINSKLLADSIKSSFKTGTEITKFIESMMLKIMFSFTVNQEAINENHTRYSGLLDTTTMMIVFDILLQFVAKYSNQSIVSVTTIGSRNSQGITRFNIFQSNTNHKISIGDLTTKIEKESAITYKIICSLLTTTNNLANLFKNYVNYLSSELSIAYLREVSKTIANPKLLQILISEQQIMLMSSTVRDLIDQLSKSSSSSINGDVDGDGDFDSDDEIKVLDDSIVTPKLRNLVYGVFGSKEFSSKLGINKKILTVGIPNGFTKNLKQKISIDRLKKTSFADKQSDFVNVVVYKIDLQNSDITYKPKKFMFELSRFIVRNDNQFLNTPENMTIDDAIRAVPTRDFGKSQSISTDVTYWTTNNGSLPEGKVLAFSDESYSFLTREEKSNVIRNHVLSYMLEVYLKLLTGISVADYHFDIVENSKPFDTEFVKLIAEQHIAHISNILTTPSSKTELDNVQTTGVLFSSTSTRSQKNGKTGETQVTTLQDKTTTSKTDTITSKQIDVKGQSTKTLSENVSKIPSQNISTLTHSLRTISNISQMTMPLSDSLLVSKRILSPKQFDRVFNIAIDPDVFEIDYDKTVKTPHGKVALEQMIQRGEIIPSSNNYFSQHNMANKTTNENSTYRFRDRDKNQGDATFEKYFIAIESYDEDGI